MDAESIVELLADAILLFFSSAEIDGLLSRIEGRRLGGLDVGGLLGYLLLLVWDDGMGWWWGCCCSLSMMGC